MTIQEAVQTNCFFKRPHWEYYRICMYKQNTGPFRHLVSCDYFVIEEDGVENLSTSLDVYPEDILATDYEIAGF